uniref:Fibrinogen C-terminal domain-containing protein n=3 Tax=Amphimedon queenslandica TaxID=400682 RepID=A0A1X7TZP3_AMPQE
MLSALVVIACLLQFIQCSNLALTFDANNSVCTASCSTCSDTDTTLVSGANHNDTALLLELLNATRSNEQAIKETKEAIDGIIRSLSIIKNTTTSNAGAINDILLLVEDFLMLHNETSPGSPPLPTSCQEVKNKQPSSPSGMYLLATANGTINTYCNMEELCGLGGGWTRLAYLDMTDSTVNCPSGFRLYQPGGVRACGRPVTSSGGCVSVEFPSNGIGYSHVCGRVTGYQYYTPDAVDHVLGSNHNNLNGEYVDGVSITRGSPRQHVWTLMAANFESTTSVDHSCPCTSGYLSQIQSFVGDHYFCESAASTFQQQLFTSDPLWDGQGCNSHESPCCNVPGIPWFHRDYGNTTTTDYIELRVCGDEGTDNEDVPVSYYEIYVQ